MKILYVYHSLVYWGGLERILVDKMKSLVNMYNDTPQIYDCYRQHSILVSTSLFEPFGSVIPEAMSCSLPVVAYDDPYRPSELVQDGEDGFLNSYYDQEAFADRLGMLMGDLVLRLRLGRRAVFSSKRFQKRFNFAFMAYIL